MKGKLGENETKDLPEFIEQKSNSKFEDHKEVLATKLDVEKINSDLGLKIEKVRSDLIRWMFIFWVTQLAAMFGMIKLLFT